MQQISGELCLFIVYSDIILFFYVNDIVIIFPESRTADVDLLIQKLNARFELRDMGQLSFFLDVRIVRNFVRTPI